jgi:S1-C subfamily serine protease
VLQLEQGGALFAPTAGVSVRELAPDSPAAARFKTLGDSPTRWLVTAVDGRPVRNPGEFYAAARGKKSVTLSLADTVSGNPAQLTLPGS